MDPLFGPELRPRAAVPLDAIVITAARREQPLADVAATTELISRPAIEATGAADLEQLLLDQTGIQVQGGIASGSGVLLQGLGDERVLVLVDGQPLVGRIGGLLDPSRLPVAGVERVEVVRGPQSTLYGSDAMGGVINVITRAPPADRVTADLSLMAGSRGRREGSLRAGVGGARLGATLDLGGRAAAIVSGRGDTDDATQRRWDGAAQARAAAGPWSFTGAAQLVDERQAWRSGPLWYVNDNLHWSGRGVVHWTGAPHLLSVTGYATAFQHHARRSGQPDPPDSIGERETQAVTRLEAVYGFAAGRHAVDGGVELTREVIRSDRVAGARAHQVTAEPFAQYTVELGPVGVVAGARASASDRWGTAVTPRLAIRWRPAAAVALRAGAGTGYRAPDFKELEIDFLNVGPGFGYVVRGNPDLRPEHARNLTLGIELTPGAWYARVQAFGTRFTDFIETAALPDSGGIQVFTYANRAAGTTAGVETEAAYVWRGLRLEGGYAWLYTHDDETGAALLGRSPHTGGLAVSLATPIGLRGRVGAVYSGTALIERSPDGTVAKRDGFLRVDVRAAWEGGGAEVLGGVDNVFAARPAGWPGFTGRRFYAGARWRLANP